MLEDNLRYALQCGLRVEEYWDMTIGEIDVFCSAYLEKEKREAEDQRYWTYTQAALTANFVASLLDGKSIPPMDEVFKVSSNEGKQEANDFVVKALLMDFADRHNEERHKKLQKAGEIK